MTVVNKLNLVKYKLVDASACFLILQRVSPPESIGEVRRYNDELICVSPYDFVHDFTLEGDKNDT